MVNQMVRKPMDRTFLRVAINSRNHLLVSHDFEDFAVAKRASIGATLGVAVIDAQQCLDDVA